jgi:hypothetical protein
MILRDNKKDVIIYKNGEKKREMLMTLPASLFKDQQLLSDIIDHSIGLIMRDERRVKQGEESFFKKIPF